MGEACIREPNLPRERVTLAAVSSLAAETIAALERCGVACLPVEPCPALAVPVQAHADMVCHPLGGRRVLAARGCEHLLASLRAEGFLPEETQRAPAARYPGDVLLNAARIGPLCLGSAHCDETLLRFCEEENIRFVPVRQGYAKCSTVIVSREAVVTADPSIAAAAEGCGLDVLRIRPGFVELPGYSCGFPGGACGKLDKTTLAFAGDLSTHPDGAAIAAFLRSHGVFPLSLHAGPLRDVGGILPLRETD